MEYRILGRTGLKVGAIALGCEGFDLYASNPELRSNIGAALAGRREKFVIQGHLCSVWEEGQYLRTRDPEKSLAAFEDLLARLGTDYVEIGMIHYVDAEADLREVLDGPIMRLAQRLRSEGLHNIDPERQRLYEFCEREGIAIDVMKAYGGGDLLSDANSPFGRPMTPVQCLEYALTRPGVAAVMAGCRSRAEIEAALGWCSATAAERDYTGALAGLDKFSWEGHCMYCGHCAPCSVGIDIAGVNKYYNLTLAQHEIPETVREHYRLLPHHASECIACGRCERNCPFGVDIIGHMRLAAAKFGY